MQVKSRVAVIHTKVETCAWTRTAQMRDTLEILYK